MFFTLQTTEGTIRYPFDFQKSWTLLFYYEGDFTPVAATELWELAKLQGTLERQGCGILCISPDSIPTHLAFLENLNRHKTPAVTFPLGSDPEGALRRRLQLETSKKYLWLLSPQGETQATFSYPHTVGANFTEALRTLLALQTEKHTPCGWVPGASSLALPPATRKESLHFLTEKEKEGAIGIDWYVCFE